MATLHPEIQTVLEEHDADGVPRLSSLSVAGARELQAELFQPPEEPMPVGSISEYRIPGPESEIPIRVYEPTGSGPFPVLVYVHGGGWVVGDLEGVDPICRLLTETVGCAVVSVDYRLAPEHPFPAPVEDCYAATQWIVANPEVAHADPTRVAVGGDSAGGNLAAAVAQLARDRGGPTLDYQLLLYPVTNHAFDTESYEANAEGYFLTRRDMRWFWDLYLDDELDGRNPYASPLQARDLSGLPPATVITSEFDPLRDDGVAYAERLSAADVPVEHREYEGTIHGFVTMLVDPDLDVARDAIAACSADLRDAFSR
ncbi:acetyl esterase [Halogranum rubrum]|uniref:Acetyl esterase n=1 Tax=Halogranum rubrum TaxID=553466 RepID=A0A1I4GWH2_9EURY|nr:alpha/beta hydrolase [Halogranum rubrum]SFL33707.1 acetyl esterase [Halogranum rubrum]